MKNIFISLVLLVLISACRENILEYSCDPVLNEIVTTHKQEYLKYAVVDIVAQSPDVQRAIFRTYDPAKKREIWLEKFNYLLKYGNYSDAEYAHVLKMKDFMHEHFFEQAYITAEAGLRKEFVSAWISYAKDKLGWSDRYIAFVIYRLYIKPEQFDAEKNALQTLQQQAVADGESFSCNCNGSEDYCGVGTLCNGDTGCTATGGCGTWWSQQCNGNCY
jgi:hypothetical protein